MSHVSHLTRVSRTVFGVGPVTRFAFMTGLPRMIVPPISSAPLISLLQTLSNPTGLEPPRDSVTLVLPCVPCHRADGVTPIGVEACTASTLCVEACS